MGDPRLSFLPLAEEAGTNVGDESTNASDLQIYFQRLEDAGYLLASIEPATYTNFELVEVL